MEDKKKIWLVDDEFAIRKLLDFVLNKSYAIEMFSDGVEAFNRLEQGGLVDAMIVDIDMPNLSGIELLKLIRSKPQFKKMVIIMLSGREKSADRIQCLDLGADDYVVKPFNPDEVSARLRNIFRRIDQL